MQFATGIVVALLALTGAPTFAAEPASLRIREVRVALPALTAFVAVTDGDGAPIDAPPASRLVASIGSAPATVDEVRAFDPRRDGIGYVFLVDVSRSLTPTQYDVLRRSLGEWLHALGPHDRAALVTFGNDVRVVQDFTADRAALAEHIGGLRPTDDLTQLHRGLTRGLELARRSDDALPDYRVIVALSDGRDDVVGGPTRQEVLDALRAEPVPIFALGLAPAGVRGAARDALGAFGEFARASGGEYESVPVDDIAARCAVVRQRILRVMRVQMRCLECRGDGGWQRLELNWRAGERRLSDGIALRIETVAAPIAAAPASPPTTAPAPTPVPPMAGRWMAPGALAFAAVLIASWLFRTGGPWGRSRSPSETATIDVARPTTNAERAAANWVRQQPGQGVRAILAGVAGFFAGSEIELDERPIVMGRDPETCQLVFPADAAKIGRQHCSLRYDRRNSVFVLLDGPSANGTFVGTGERLAPGVSRRLRSGDGFHLVDPSTRFEVRIERRPRKEGSRDEDDPL